MSQGFQEIDRMFICCKIPWKLQVTCDFRSFVVFVARIFTKKPHAYCIATFFNNTCIFSVTSLDQFCLGAIVKQNKTEKYDKITFLSFNKIFHLTGQAITQFSECLLLKIS